MNNHIQAILTALVIGHRAVRMGQHSWRWSPRYEGAPSLANPHTSALFRADYVTELDGQMILTPAGKISSRL